MGLIALTIFTVAYPTIKERMGKAKVRETGRRGLIV
jgi:hypothetical protein